MSIESSITLEFGRISNYNTLDTQLYESKVYIVVGGSRGIMVIYIFDIQTVTFTFVYKLNIGKAIS